MKHAVQLIVYPDSMGGNLNELSLIVDEFFPSMFSGMHILPFFPSAGDRGFSPKTYFEVEPDFGTWEDVKQLGRQYDILADIMVNHISYKSEYVQDYLKNGEASPYRDFFIDLNKIWEDGIVRQSDIDNMFLRRVKPYSTYQSEAFGEKTLWTTFGKEEPSEQVDLDINSSDVRKYFADIFAHFTANNINIVRLDAVGYIIKKMGTSCFFVEPDIWGFMQWIAELASQHEIILLPEVHSHYSTQLKLSENGFWIYDFILPYRVLEALLFNDGRALAEYLSNRPHNQFTMLDCHDGIPVKPDLDGLLDSKDAQKVVDICLSRGANLSKIISEKHRAEDGFDVHQIRGTFYSLLNEDEDAYLAARAIQLFTPGIPQIYYVGLLAGKNDQERGNETGEGREINRKNYTKDEIREAVNQPVVQRLLKLIEFRNSCDVFDGEFEVLDAQSNELRICWTKADKRCVLFIDLATNRSVIEYVDEKGMTLQYEL